MDDGGAARIRMAITQALAGQPRASQSPEPESGATDTDGLTQTEQRMLQALGREPTGGELAAELDPSSP
jgi:DNA-directed RNA polymerase sigma subunit (sigma70/sigma32)